MTGRRRSVALAAAGAALAAGGAVVADLGVLGTTEAADAAPEPAAATATASVERRDLVTREELSGTLGYDDAREIPARLPGTVTFLPEAGTVIRPGGILARIDTRPVVLMDGGLPAWRTLEQGVDPGRDVRQLERNLVALGHDPDGDVEVDDSFDRATRQAVERWQAALGRDRTGAVELGEVVFLPGARRVGTVSARVGAQAGGALLTTTSTRRVVSVAVDARRQDLVTRGQRVDVELPGGRRAAGRVAAVARVARQAGEETVVDVEVRPLRSRASGTLDGAPVTVHVETERARQVLAVPVAALLALAGGGHGVELVDGGSRRIVAVDTGTYADGWVQVTGPELRAGSTVVVPA